MASKSLKRQKVRTVILYCENAYYLFEAYFTDPVFCERDLDMMHIQASFNMSKKYAEDHLLKALCCDRVGDEKVFNSIVIKVIC